MQSPQNISDGNVSGHNLLAQHYFLDSLDLHNRFLQHWEDQPRRSSRVKSFIDLMMACECLLKAQCILSQNLKPLGEAYGQVKKFGHNIDNLSRFAEKSFPMQAHGQSRDYFGQFSVSLRYSAESHHFFNPIENSGPPDRPNYCMTLGNSVWLQGANNVVLDRVEKVMGFGRVS